jgi:hypothetical protein
MTEIQLTYLAGFKLLIVALIGFCYSRAGRGWSLPIIGKFRRRVYLSIMLLVTLLVSALMRGLMTWWLFGALIASWGVYYGVLSVGYGANSWLRKIFKRIGQQFIVGALQGAGCVLIAVATGTWGLFTLSVVCSSLVLGTLGGWADDDVNASFKEAIVGASLFLFPMFMV